VATDHHVYVFPNKLMRTYVYSGEPYKVPIREADLERGSMSLRVDGGPKIWSAPLGR
jgi:hypothetical protein